MDVAVDAAAAVVSEAATALAIAQSEAAGNVEGRTGDPASAGLNTSSAEEVGGSALGGGGTGSSGVRRIPTTPP
eukprot:1772365-Alexandrium_andersonii.AAC.1